MVVGEKRKMAPPRSLRVASVRKSARRGEGSAGGIVPNRQSDGRLVSWIEEEVLLRYDRSGRNWDYGSRRINGQSGIPMLIKRCMTRGAIADEMQ